MPWEHLSDEQLEIRALVRTIARERIAPRAAEIDASHEFPWDVVELFREHGIFGLLFDEEHGGTGTGTLLALVAIEEVSKVCATSGLILAVQELGSLALKLAGTEASRRRPHIEIWPPEAAISVIWCGRYDTQYRRRCAKAACAPANPPALTHYNRSDAPDARCSGRALSLPGKGLFARTADAPRFLPAAPCRSTAPMRSRTGRAASIRPRPTTFPKAYFLMLMKNERMAEFQTRFDDASGVFRIFRDGALQVEASLADGRGRARRSRPGSPRIFAKSCAARQKSCRLPAFSFSDVARRCCTSSISRACARLEEKLGRPVDPLRFRPNVVIEGLAAFGRTRLDRKRRSAARSDAASAGSAPAAARRRTSTRRPAARDMQIPRSLEAEYGHEDFGVYLAATTSGRIAVGDRIEVHG